MGNTNESGTPPATAPDAPATTTPTKPNTPEPRLAQSAPQVPSKGRVVMYYAHINDEIVEHTAHVVKVWGDGPNACVNLAVFDENGQLYARTSVSKGGPDQPGTWGWPRRAS
jgi:hypothetical protein